jgi:hypothetical protein
MKTPSGSQDISWIATALLAIACGLGFILWLIYARDTGDNTFPANTTVSSSPRASPLLPERPANRSTDAQPAGPLPSRPPAPVLYQNLERADFQWIFKRLRATDAELNWITAGQFSELIGHLRPGVERGDARATVLFGWIAERCRLLRSAEQQASWRQINSARLQQLAAQDQAEYLDVVARQDQWEQSFRNVCKSQINQDYVDRKLEKTAAEQDGASLWLLSRRSNNHAEDLRLMSQAASAGFAQAQYEFARSLIMDADARKAVPDSPSAVSLLTEAASEVPEAKAELAQCLFNGCDGAQPDHGAALDAAREAAAEGEPDAIIALGSQLSAGMLSPDEVSAWRLFKASLAAQGCYGDEDAAFGLEPRVASAPSPLPSEVGQNLAVTFWQRYGADAKSRLGCAG